MVNDISDRSAKAKPRGKPFVKGESGNPHGRPKELEDVKAAAREYSAQAIERLAFWMNSDDPKASVSATNALLDRAFGKPQQSMDVDMRLSLELATRLEAARARKIS
jgi:hypothetical protein